MVTGIDKKARDSSDGTYYSKWLSQLSQEAPMFMVNSWQMETSVLFTAAPNTVVHCWNSSRYASRRPVVATMSTGGAARAIGESVA